jgi:hypothetical protein
MVFSSRLLASVSLVFMAGTHAAKAHVQFDHPYAPSETWVKAPEQAFREDINLNGSWQFQPVALPQGYKEAVDPAPELPAPTPDGWDKVPLKVPSPWNVNIFADRKGMGGDFRCYPSYPPAWETIKMGWIKRSFDVPAAWKGKRLFIHVAAAAGDLQFQVNGKDAGKKFDVFFPFDLDVTELVNYGASNEILVGVRKPELLDKQGKFGKRTWQGGSFWGQQVVGIWQDIDLVAVPVVRVTDTFIQPLVDQDTLKVGVTLHNDGAADTAVDVAGLVHAWTNLAPKDGVEAPVPKWKLEDATALSLPSSTVTVPAHGDAIVTLTQKVGGALKFWTTEDPNLYGLLVNVKAGGTAVDTKYTRFGWRQVKFDGIKMTLNGQPLVLKGDSWHFLGIPQMTRRYPWAWFTAMHDAHLNAVRLHAEPYPEFYLDMADEMGVMVLDETAIWASDGGPKLDDDAFWKDTEGHISSLILRDRSHPCVFGWSVCNEVRPIVQNVFHNPPGMYDVLLGYYKKWYDLCRQLDPTREWVSADGDGDGGGILPTNVIHYGGDETMQKAVALGKPWGVGEASSAYYSTPEEVDKKDHFGERAYESFEARMEGVAIETYAHLMLQRKYNADYRSVFNLVWYGLQPLPLGLADTTKAPTLDDGVFFPAFQENTPGVQPERLGPYCTTLNPGYDPGLSLYKTWPLFDAIKDAQAEPPVDFPLSNPPLDPKAPDDAPITSSTPPIKSADIVGGSGSALKDQLTKLGVPFDTLKGGSPELLFVDGANPPDASAKTQMDGVLSSGGTVVVWGVSAGSLDKLNALLPAPLELTARQSSSLVVAHQDPVVAGLKNSGMYFTELSPRIILDGGLGGAFVDKGTVLLAANNTDWGRWNKEAEFAKTSMVVRSEREAKPSGAALVVFKQGQGRLLVCNLPADSALFKAQTLDRQILANLGVPLKAAVDVGGPFLRTGEMVRVLAAGRFEAATENHLGKPNGNPKDNDELANKRWHIATADKSGVIDLRKQPLDGPGENAVSYLNFWVLSPKALDNLLLDPNLPKVDLNMQTADGVEVWLNGKSVLQSPAGGSGDVVASTLTLQQGWNHFLVRLEHGKGDDKFSAHLVSSQPDFLNDIKSALQKP